MEMPMILDKRHKYPAHLTVRRDTIKKTWKIVENHEKSWKIRKYQEFPEKRAIKIPQKDEFQRKLHNTTEKGHG